MHFLYTTPQQGAVVITNLKTKSSTSLIFEPTLDMFKFHFPVFFRAVCRRIDRENKEEISHSRIQSII